MKYLTNRYFNRCTFTNLSLGHKPISQLVHLSIDQQGSLFISISSNLFARFNLLALSTQKKSLTFDNRATT